jgi:hypothetical protein
MIEIANGVGAWAEKRIRRIQRDELGPVGCADHELESARRKLAARECRQSMMRAVNAAIRKHRTKPDAIARISAELEARVARSRRRLIPELLKPDCAAASASPTTSSATTTRRSAGCAIASPCSSGARPRSTRGRGSGRGSAGRRRPGPDRRECARAAAADLLSRQAELGGPRPAQGRGFRWAPSAGAWQRQLTGNAIAAARAIVRYPD